MNILNEYVLSIKYYTFIEFNIEIDVSADIIFLLVHLKTSYFIEKNKKNNNNNSSIDNLLYFAFIYCCWFCWK